MLGDLLFTLIYPSYNHVFVKKNNNYSHVIGFCVLINSSISQGLFLPLKKSSISQGHEYFLQLCKYLCCVYFCSLMTIFWKTRRSGKPSYLRLKRGVLLSVLKIVFIFKMPCPMKLNVKSCCFNVSFLVMFFFSTL